MVQKNLLTNDPLELNAEIRELAQREELGELRKVYRASNLHTGSVAGGMLFMWLGFLWILLTGFLLFSRPSFPAWSILPGLAPFALGLLMILVSWKRSRSQHISLWQAGFIYERRQVRQVFRWDQIESIKGSAAYSPQFGHSIIIYKVRRLDGLTVKLDATFPEIADVIDHLLEAFARQVAPPDLRIVSHRRKTFSHLKLDRQGVSNQLEALSWQEMEEIAVEHGVMTVFPKD